MKKFISILLTFVLALNLFIMVSGAEIQLKTDKKTVNVKISESADSYSYYVLKDGKVIYSKPYSPYNTCSIPLPDDGEYRLRVYLSSRKSGRSVIERKITNADIDEWQLYDVIYEAEDALMQGAVKASAARNGYSGTGYATGFTQKSGNLWQLTVEVPKSGHYDIEVCHASDSYKENILNVNGSAVGNIISNGTGAFETSTIGGVYLEAGENVFTIKEVWGWFDLDYLRIRTGETVSQKVYNVSGKLSNPYANTKTKNIMSYLMDIYGEKTLAGQYTDHGYNTEVDAIYALTGKYPAIRGFDFIFYSPNSGWTAGAKDTELALAWDKTGGLSTFSWHWHAPLDNKHSFYASETNFDLSKAVTDLDIATKTPEELLEMKNSGRISEECYALIGDIDVISEQLSILQQNNVTVLWRPLHEASGGWFWWGAKGAEPYKWLWNLLYERQTWYHKLNNLIWVWNAQDAAWYPGDDTVDIIGTDIYAEKQDYSAQTDMFLKTAGFAPDKPVALTENGVVPDSALMERDNTHWLWFNTWCREFVVDSAGNYIGTYTEKELLKKVYESESVITRDELPAVWE